jgi:hypothetical protein
VSLKIEKVILYKTEFNDLYREGPGVASYSSCAVSGLISPLCRLFVLQLIQVILNYANKSWTFRAPPRYCFKTPYNKVRRLTVHYCS